MNYREWTNYGVPHHYRQPLPGCKPSYLLTWEAAHDDVANLNWFTHGHRRKNPQYIRTRIPFIHREEMEYQLIWHSRLYITPD